MDILYHRVAPLVIALALVTAAGWIHVFAQMHNALKDVMEHFVVNVLKITVQHLVHSILNVNLTVKMNTSGSFLYYHYSQPL